MKRSGPLLRKTPLRNTKPLARRTALRKVRHDRIRARRAVQFGVQAAMCRLSPCLACGVGPCDAHHHPSRARGGKDQDTVGLCRGCHTLFHDMGAVEFYRRTKVDVIAAALVMRSIAAGEREPHSGKCTSADICDACRDEAERVNERRVASW